MRRSLSTSSGPIAIPAEVHPELLVIEPRGRYARLVPAVVDASVLASMLFDEANAVDATAAIDGVELHAPDLLDHELVSVALKKARDGFEDPARLGLSVFATLEIARHAVEPSAQWAIALANGLSAYDAAYLALAVELSCPLITFDQKLAAAARRVLQGE
jgi:predicted nucleic acid-binding protein